MYPKNPITLEEAAEVLAEFAKTAPGRLPERVQVAIDIAKSPSRIHALRKRIESIISVHSTQYIDGEEIRNQLHHAIKESKE